MPLRDILVHIDDTTACQKRLEAAIHLSEAYEAHLIGLYVLRPLMLPPGVISEMGTEFIDAEQESARVRAGEAEQIFKAATERAGVASEWRWIEGSALVSILSFHARCVDLIVGGQRDEDDPHSLGGIMDNVALESGRPVLVVPYIGASQPIGENVLVAWNASREAARAVNDSLPLLKRAKKVDVITINTHVGDLSDDEIPSADICLHLARHGVNTEAHQTAAGDIEVGDILLSRAADWSTDLIVMGAYGHSRLREIVLGGATKHLLKYMTVPVLMSH